MAQESVTESAKIPFENAIDKAGFGAYSYIMLCLNSMAILSFVCIGYGSTIIVPTSACELGTSSSQQGLLAAAPVVGLILGGMLWGYLADTRGRRSMLLVAFIGGAVVNLLASISVNYIMLMVFQFIASLFASGMYSMSVSLLSESVPMAKRNLMVLLAYSISLMSQGIMSVLAIPIIPLTFSIYLSGLGIYWNSWRTLMVVYSCPSIITAICLFFMQESPKFVYTTGDDEKTLKTLKIIHKINHFRSKEEFQVKGLLRPEDHMKDGDSRAQNQITPLFKAPLLKYTLITTILCFLQQVGAFLVWLPTIADRFVRILQTGEAMDLTMCGILTSNIETPINEQIAPCALNETSLLMVFGVGVLQAVVNVVISSIVSFTGRRNLVMIITAFCGLSGILVNLVPNAIGSAVFFVILLLGIIVLGLYTAIMVSLFPTHLRVLAIAFAFTFGRVGTFASIQILNLLLAQSCDVGFYLFSALFASSAIIATFLPDDRRKSTTKEKPIQ